MNKQSKRGRPVEKEARKKVGLSLDGVSATKLDELSAMTGLTKSAIVERAIGIFAERQKIIEARIKDIEKHGEDAFLDLDKIIKERKDKTIESSTGKYDDKIDTA